MAKTNTNFNFANPSDKSDGKSNKLPFALVNGFRTKSNFTLAATLYIALNLSLNLTKTYSQKKRVDHD